jgi:hypothetical protein
VSILEILIYAEQIASNETSLASLLVAITASDSSKHVNTIRNMQYTTPIFTLIKATNLLGNMLETLAVCILR